LSFLSLVVAATVGSGQCCAQRPNPLDQIRVLVVIDTGDPNLRSAVLKDRENIKRTLKQLIPAERYTVDEMVGEDNTPDKIIGYYRHLKTGPNEGLVFYFSGHGATLPDREKIYRQQVMAMGYVPMKSRGYLFPRDTLVTAMRFKNPGLAVVLTDCCSNHIPYTLPPLITSPANLGAQAPDEAGPREISPAVRNLFFEHRGVIDVTAADHDVAGFDPQAGSFFTLALTRLLGQDVASFKPINKDFLRWKDFFPRLREATNEEMQFYKNKRGDKDGSTQYAKAFQLSGETSEVNRPKWRFGVQTFDNDGDGVVCRRVFPDTPAAAAGLEDGDVLLAINGQVIKSRADFADAIDTSGGKIKVEFRKPSGEKLSREIKLDRLP
jgi:hypothetical protein